jgi:hypothetical protein
MGEGGHDKMITKIICSENTEFAVLTVCHELKLKDVLSKLRDAFRNSDNNIWLDLKEITKTDFTTESVYNLKDFIKEHQGFYPSGKVVVVADTELSRAIVKMTLSLLKLDGFEGHVQLFSSRRAALRWAKLADLLSS